MDGVRLDRREHDQLNEAFWLSHMRVGFGVFVGECIAVVVYLRATPAEASRGLLLGIAVGAACAGVLSFFALGWIARQSWRVVFSLVWSLGCGWALAACAHLDGGLDSPLLYLVLFPVIYAALAYRPWAAVTCGLSALAQLAVISASDPDITTPRANLLMIAAVIVGMSALAVAAAIYRDQLQRSEAVLLTDIAALADTDGLTGCLNHRAFHEHLAIEIERAWRHHRPLSSSSSTSTTSIRSTTRMATPSATRRWWRSRRRCAASCGAATSWEGSEETIPRCILSDTPIDGAETHARRITRTLERRPAPSVAVSIGLAGLDPAEPSAAHLLRDADRALYHVKDTGRHGIAAKSSSGALIRLAG